MTHHRTPFLLSLGLLALLLPSVAQAGDDRLSGIVHVSGTTVRVGDVTLEYKRVARTLKRFDGFRVEVAGRRTLDGFDPSELISPRRTSFAGTLARDGSSTIIGRDGERTPLIVRSQARSRLLAWLTRYGVPVELKGWHVEDGFVVDAALYTTNSGNTLLHGRPTRWSLPRGVVRGVRTTVEAFDRKDGMVLVRKGRQLGWAFTREVDVQAPRKGANDLLSDLAGD